MPLIDLNGLGHFKDRENAMIAENFAATKDYAAGDYCYFNGTLKKFKTAHAAGAWIGTDAEDAKLAGDVSSLKESISQNTRNLADMSAFAKGSITVSDGVATGTAEAFNSAFGSTGIPFGIAYESGTQYAVSFEAKNDNGGPYTGLVVQIKYTDATSTAISVLNNITEYTKYKIISAAGKTISTIAVSYSSYGAHVWRIKNFQIEKGTSTTEFIPHISAVDYVARESNDTTHLITDYTEQIDVDGVIKITKSEMESGSFTSGGYTPDLDRSRNANHYIKARKGDIVVGHRKTADILMGITDAPNGTTTLYTSGWRTADFALATPFDGYYVLLGKTALDNFDGDFTIYPAKQFFKALPERYYLDEIAATLASITEKQTEPCLCFPLITDIHYGATATSSHPYLFHKTYRNILKVIQEKRSDAIVCLGDVTEGDFNAKQTAIDFGTRVNDMLMMLDTPYLLTIGNHDDNRYSNSASNRFDNSDICKVNTAYVDNEVVYNTTTNGRDYYVDFPNYKIRLISIDAVGNRGYAYDTNTVTWFTNTALNTPDNYLAVILTHVSPVSSQNYNNTEVTNGTEIAQAIEDYISGGKDAFQLYGHSHCDVAFTSPYLSIATCCSKYTNENGDPALWPEGATMPTREEYTATEDCWDYVIIRPKSKKVNLIRFGAGNDREFTYGTA